MSGIIPRAQKVVCEIVLPKYREYIIFRTAKINVKGFTSVIKQLNSAQVDLLLKRLIILIPLQKLT